MPQLLFRLNGVPEDEAEAMRDVLHEHAIDFYETSAGRWGISMAGLWLRDDSGQFEQARRLLDDFQHERTQQARDSYTEQSARGQNDTLPARFARDPVRLLLYLLAIVLIVLFTILPFARLAGWI